MHNTVIDVIKGSVKILVADKDIESWMENAGGAARSSSLWPEQEQHHGLQSGYNTGKNKQKVTFQLFFFRDSVPDPN